MHGENQRIVEGRKRCSKCSEWKELAQFYRTPRSSTGFKSECKVCSTRATGSQRKIVDGKQFCRPCGNWKPEEEFEKNKRCSNGRNSRCRQCATKKTNEYISRTLGAYLKDLSNRNRATRRWRRSNRGKRHLWSDTCITPEYLRGLYDAQDGKCAITGIEMTHVRGVDDLSRNISIDRIDSSKGYVHGNVQLVCKIVNLMKHEQSLEELRFWCYAILDGEQPKQPAEVFGE